MAGAGVGRWRSSSMTMSYTLLGNDDNTLLSNLYSLGECDRFYLSSRIRWLVGIGNHRVTFGVFNMLGPIQCDTCFLSLKEIAEHGLVLFAQQMFPSMMGCSTARETDATELEIKQCSRGIKFLFWLHNTQFKIEIVKRHGRLKFYLALRDSD
jgi:hypothetical protein